MTEEIKKATSTLEVVAGVIGLIKSGSIILAMALIEWARSRQKLAENRQAVAETELSIVKQHTEIDHVKTIEDASRVVDEFLHRRHGDNSTRSDGNPS